MRYYEESRDSDAISAVIGQCFLVGKTKCGNRPHSCFLSIVMLGSRNL